MSQTINASAGRARNQTLRPDRARPTGVHPTPERGAALYEAMLVGTIGLLVAWSVAEAAVLAWL